MKIFGCILLVLVLIVIAAVAIAYLDGRTLPVNHSVSVTGVVPAPPEKVFARIADFTHGADWRPVKSVTVLPPDDGRDHWSEYLGHGQTMIFLATRSEAPTRRDVLLDDPNAAYGGTWTYELSPGPSPATTNLRITETGYINPPLYRFMMAHIMGPTSNLNQYLSDMQAAAVKP